MLAKLLTIASRCHSTPKFVGHACYSAGSFLGVPLVTGVGQGCPKGCTRATSLTICRSIGGRTTADSCREGPVTTLLVATMQVRTLQTKRQAEMLTDIMSMSNHATTSTTNLTNYTRCIYSIHMHHRHHCRHGASTHMYLCTHTNHNGVMHVML